MNKLLTKIVGVVLGTTMAVGVGVGVAVNSERANVDSQVNAATTYEQLTSISNIDESADYVLGIDGTGFHYEGTSSWGKTALPSSKTPLYYTLKKANDGNSFTAKTTISSTTYYLQIPTTNTFSMATSAGTNTDIIIGTTQVSETNYAVANKSTTARHLRINGTSGLRSYAGTTGSMAYFYKVVSDVEATYSVTYDANGATSGNVPTDATKYSKNATVTVKGNIGSPALAKTDYVFDGWNTKVDGTGTSYAAGGTFSISANTTLYAKWAYDGVINTYNFGSGVPTGWSSSIAWTGNQLLNNSATLPTFTFTTDFIVRKVVVEWRATQAKSNVTCSITINNVSYGSTVLSGKKDNPVEQEFAPQNSSDKTFGSTTIVLINNCTDSTGCGTFYLGNIIFYGEEVGDDFKLSAIGSITAGTPTAKYGDAGWDVSSLVISGTVGSTATADITSYITITVSESVPTTYDGTISTVTVVATPKQGMFVGELQAKTFNNVSCSYTPAVKGKYSDYPLSVAEMLALAPSIVDTYDCYYTTGIVSQKGEWESDSEGISYELYISDNGATTTQLCLFDFDYLSGETMTEELFGTINVGDTLTIYGSITVTQGGEYYYFELDEEDTYSYLTEHTVAYNPETDTSTGKYHIATSSDIVIGNHIALVSAEDDYVMASQGSNNFRGGAANKDNVRSVINPTNVIDLEIVAGNKNGTFGLKLKNGTYLYAASSDNNYLKTQDSVDDNASFTISISNNKASIVAQGTNTRNVLRYNYNNGSPLFACYESTSSTGVDAVIYVFETYEDEAIAYATQFNSANVCGTNDNTPASSSLWSAQETKWGKLTQGAQYLLTHGTANASGDQIGQCLARYDMVVAKRNFNDFMLRHVPESANPNLSIKTLNNTTVIATVVIISVISVSTLCGYFLLRKRKEER